MSARRPRYNTEEALERIWHDSGDEEDFESDESEVVSSLVLMSLHRDKKVFNILRKAVMMKLPMAEMVGIKCTVQDKDLQDNKKLRLSGKWHVAQHHVTSHSQEILVYKYRQEGLNHIIILPYL